MPRLLLIFVLELCLGCGGASQLPAAARPAAEPVPKAAPEPARIPAELGMPDVMQVHFAYVTAARDAVIAGRLEQVGPALRALSVTPPTTDTPVDWLPWLQEVQSTAGNGAVPQTLEAAAASVAALANACGDCHRATRSGQGGAAQGAERYTAEDRSGLAEKMARHQFSAEALWLGLTIPEHQAWSAGAEALLNIRVPGLVDVHGKPLVADRRPSGTGDLQGARDPRLPAEAHAATEPQADVADLDAALRELRALGGRADQARTTGEKQRVFAELITRCGDCHAAVGLDLTTRGTLTALPTARPNQRVLVTGDKIEITEKIQFAFNAATIMPQSHALLDELVSAIQSHPQLRKISIEGHTASDGDAAYNLKLSRGRAAAVLRYFIEHGVAVSRLSSTGFGEQRPLASNDEAAGREANRRVEFLIAEQAEVKQAYEVDPATGRSRRQ